MMIKPMDTDAQQESQAVQVLNERFRQTLRGGRVMLSASVAAMDDEAVNEILDIVRSYDDFTPDNNPADPAQTIRVLTVMLADEY